MIAWLAHPLTLLGIVLLAVNDHLLKPAYPGLVTGKLSDFAGLLVAPPLLGVVVSAIAPQLTGARVAGGALVLTGLGFTVTKSTMIGAAVASAGWSAISGPSVILADRTDLVALPALGLVAWTWTRASRLPISERMLRRFGVLVVLPTATLAVAATSAPYYRDTVAVASWRNLIVVGEANAYLSQNTDHQGNDTNRWQVSEEGRVWRSMTPAERAEFEKDRATLATTAQRSCLPDQPARCYRIVEGHLRVEVSDDAGATWAVTWEIPDSRRDYLARSYEQIGDVETYLSSYALAVHPVPGGHVVVVANRRDGIALRDVSGTWTRLGFDTDGDGRNPPPSLDAKPSVLITETVVTILVALLMVAVAGRRLARHGAGRITHSIFFGVGSLLALVGGLGTRIESTLMLAVVATIMTLLGMYFSLAGTIGLLASTPWRVVGVRRLPLILLTGLAVAAAWWAPFVAWARGLVNYPVAVLLGLVAVLVGLAVANRLGQPVEASADRAVDPPRSALPGSPTSASAELQGDPSRDPSG
ncbi:hypothetical protein GCM10027290_03360 [Micromonospora sonneratiae]|uniref:Uncharacterized protein n=1 Tax=Micromonospora sonneratiae TaxID=1184706 RepID=A0ABW3Y899_9ACTN